ncbi:MAG TPA: hypothetical protein VIU33_09065 [Nitrospiria bacterium]
MKTQDQISGECTWCESALTEAIHGVGSSYTEAIPPDEVFHRVELPKSSRSLYGAVVKPGSRAFPEGFRLIFASCSDRCAGEIEKSLASEPERFEIRTRLSPEV